MSLNRRLLLTGGSGVLGVTVLNTVTGCSGTDPAGTPSAAAPPPGLVGDWRRVDLSFVSVYLLVRGGEVAVVDTGTPGSEASVEAGLKAAGLGWDSVRHVILTHQHQDHAGGLAAIAPLVGATLYAGEADVAAIDAAGETLTPLKDGDEVFGLQIIGTPGHTLGHMSVFEPGTGVLVTGDALRNQNGLEGSAPQYTTDATLAAASVKKLAGLEVKAILPGHGEPLTAGAKEALQKLAATL
ncbi:hydrolase [Actinoplanes lobatus]|uniref:Hydrolase n=1 Tax=Actinoplanes lobatus TaxID=113568 RepID=A0A7W7HGP8_9ACTN|nr:MBL fold metallo-hydrolase [Actinoplanes lobatus]MBB4749767.1 glyoxylase-like metal-dependent hydrolase (beta-lactamase superfamily II) [Actinoplanes lobatus]GGN76148.1 hydrolase [Actinoplanes lobatus]GIE38502.1 hydrolase [Actinoplanes lobatus]